MSKFEVKCTRPGCGQGVETPDIDEVMAWSAAHDEACPALKAPEVAPEIIAEAVKRGTASGWVAAGPLPTPCSTSPAASSPAR